jgi:hypothetical protein
MQSQSAAWLRAQPSPLPAHALGVAEELHSPVPGVARPAGCRRRSDAEPAAPPQAQAGPQGEPVAATVDAQASSVHQALAAAVSPAVPAVAGSGHAGAPGYPADGPAARLRSSFAHHSIVPWGRWPTRPAWRCAPRLRDAPFSTVSAADGASIGLRAWGFQLHTSAASGLTPSLGSPVAVAIAPAADGHLRIRGRSLMPHDWTS